MAAPHGIYGVCAAYVPEYPCGRCGQDCQLHEPDGAHINILNEQIICMGCIPAQGFPSPTEGAGFEGGGGRSGGGGASGGW